MAIQRRDAQHISYALITPARNEEAFIEQTIRSVIRQTVLPSKWVIVSDGSTDHTDDIVRMYVAVHPWIELVRMPERRDRHFAAKVRCFNAGLERLKGEIVEIIGNLDADITFGDDYFEFLLTQFANDEELGVAGTPFVEGTQSYNFSFTSVEHVSGACQLFRWDCFREIGGYQPVKGGGIDWIAVTTARMRGWKTRTFTGRLCHHHRPMGTAEAGAAKAWFRLGAQEYYLGSHPLWQLFRAVYQMSRRPYFFGGVSLFAGYTWSWLKGTERPVSEELIRFHRSEQLGRLRGCMSRLRQPKSPKRNIHDSQSKSQNVVEHKHVVVCICTYKRPTLLEKLLETLRDQETDGQFTYSIVVVDNDALQSAEKIVLHFVRSTLMNIKYCVEPRQGISLARNKAVANASGDFVAFIDDDEFPSKRWLYTMLKTCNDYGVDGVLGPVKEHFDEAPPAWIIKGKFFRRPTYPTGTQLDWKETRTGNALVRSGLFEGLTEPFQTKFRGGEDQDFFRRMMENGRVFIWCNDAPVFELVPPARWKRKYLLRRAVLGGSMWAIHDPFALRGVFKSIVAIPIYAIALPFALMLGQHRFMALLIKLCHHLGKLLARVGLNPVAEVYVSG